MVATLLRVLLAILPFIRLFTRWRNAQAEKERARELAEAVINKAEVKASREVAEVYAERRPDDAAANRLRDGTL